MKQYSYIYLHTHNIGVYSTNENKQSKTVQRVKYAN